MRLSVSPADDAPVPSQTPHPTVPEWLRRVVERAQDAPGVRSRGRLRSDGGGRRSAVLILFGASKVGSGASSTAAGSTGSDGSSATATGTGTGAGTPDPLPDVLLLERAHTLRAHAGQVAFPGGALDPDDASPEAAALREAEEETGLDPSGVAVVGQLPPLYVAPSDFLVTPVVGWWQRPTPVRAVDLAEVASVHQVPVDRLLDPAQRFTVRLPNGYHGPAFWLDDLVVWGFTGGLLDRLFTVAGWTRPWDRSRVEDLPQRLLELARRSRPDDTGGPATANLATSAAPGSPSGTPQSPTDPDRRGSEEDRPEVRRS